MFNRKSKHELEDHSLLELLVEGEWWAALHRFPAFRIDFITIGLSTLLVNILGLALPLMMLQVYDRIVPNHSISTLNWLIWGVVFAVLLESGLRICRGLLTSWLSARFEHVVGQEVLEHFLGLDLDTFGKTRSGAHMERLNAVSILRGFYSGQLLQILFDIPFVLLYLWVVFYVAGPIVLYTIAVIVVYAIVVTRAQRKYAIKRGELQKINDVQMDFIVETLSGIHTIKSFALEETFLRRYESIQKGMASQQLQLNKNSLAPVHYGPVFAQVNLLGIIALGAGAVIAGDLTVGMMTAATIISARVMQPVQQMAAFWLKKADAENARKQLTHLLNEDLSEFKPSEEIFADIEGDISFSKVYLDQGDALETLRDISFSIEKGECVGITGDVPQQTEMLVQLLCGLKQPDAGSIMIDEFNMAVWEHGHFQGRVQYLPREGHLFHGTIMDNLSMFNHKNRPIALRVAKLLHLDSMIADLPRGYETSVGGGANSNFSYGMVQRICIARALVVRPRILIFNRTLTGLDKETQKVLASVISEMKGHCTILCVADEDEFFIPLDRVLKVANSTVAETHYVPFEEVVV